MFQAVKKEFETSPIQTIASLAALLSVPISLIGGVVLQATQGGQFAADPAPLSRRELVPFYLIVVGSFAAASAFGLSQLAVRVNAAVTSFLCSILLALLAQCAVAAFAWTVLRSQFAFVERKYAPATIGGEPTLKQELVIANQDVNGFVFTMSALIVLVFVAATLHKAETSSAKVSDDETYVFLIAGLIWVALVMSLGGAVMESVLRSGVTAPTA